MSRWMHCIIILLVLSTAIPALAFKIKGLRSPQSVVVDPSSGIYYISNIAGKPREKDGSGFITRAGPSGKIMEPSFIESGRKGVVLNAPGGLMIQGEELIVTDRNLVRRFDKHTGSPLGTIDFALLGVRSIHDITSDADGGWYVSDTSGNAIYRIDPKKNFQITLLIKSPALGKPKRLIYDPAHRRLIVTSGKTGRILGVDFRGKVIPLIREKFRDPDGITFDQEGNLIVADSAAGKIFRLRNYSTVETIRENLITPADISFDFRNRQILVPSRDGNVVFPIPLN